jgi:ABC-type glutathione transport system ATPase component
MVLLQAEDLWVEGYGHGRQQPVLKAVDLKIMAGRITVLIGESGAGKTMLARALCGLLPDGFFVSRGRIAYQGKRLATPASWSRMRGRKFFYSPQNAAASLNPVLTIGRQIAETSRIGQEQLLDMLAGLRFADPQRILEAYPFMLSGGENQRCLLAMALAGRSELLILDEPTAELDPAARADFIRILQTCQRCYGLTVLLISHHLDLIRDIAQDLYVMCSGAIVDSGTFNVVLAAPGHPYTREIAAYLGGV